MARTNSADSWTVCMIGVSFRDGKRIEKPFEKFSASELQEIARRKNAEALKAAGYVPVGAQQVERRAVNG